MQHCFDNGHGPNVSVPYYGQAYHGKVFLDYPRSKGWRREWLLKWTWSSSGKSSRETHAFLQSWLFFGLIESVTGVLSLSIVKNFRVANLVL